MVHNITFVLDLFHDKKCGNYINFIFLYFMEFDCIGFSIKLVKNQTCNEDQYSFATILRGAHE